MPTPQDEIYGIALLFTEKDYLGDLKVVVNKHPSLPKGFNDEIESAVFLGDFELFRNGKYDDSAGVFMSGGYPDLEKMGIPHDDRKGLSSLKVTDGAQALKLRG